MKEYQRLEHEFPPVYNKNSRILILGSFPSVKSRERSFYYGHPQNRFWRVLSMVLRTDVPENIDGKKKLLLEHRIALWDVIESCDIVGSSDSSIRNVIPANIQSIIEYAKIKAVFVNGKTAERLYKKYSEDKTKITAIGLPSTSPANAAYSVEKLYEQWQVIQNYLQE